MGGENQDKGQDSEATVVANITIKPGCEKDYDEWFRHFLVVLKKSTWLLRYNNDHGNNRRFNCEAYNSQV
jgi:hypothetical protein